MSKLLVIMRADYADEFDVEGFSILSEEQFNQMIKGAKKEIKENGFLDVCFGTNESLIWENADDFKRDFKVKEITDQEEATIVKLFDGSSFGTKVPASIYHRFKEVDSE